MHYHYDVNNLLIAETLADGTILREYIYLDGEPLALKEYEGNPGLYYFLNDHLGTPQQLVSTDGEVVWQAAYLLFGKAQLLIEQVGNNIRFPGQYFDNETGLHYNWNRYYDPETGRYISADPIGLRGGINLYSYVQNDPVNAVDPWGLWPKWKGFQPQYPNTKEGCKQSCKDQGLEYASFTRISDNSGMCVCREKTCEEQQQSEKPKEPDFSNTPESCAMQLATCLSGAKTAWQKAKCYIAYAACAASNFE